MRKFCRQDDSPSDSKSASAAIYPTLATLSTVSKKNFRVCTNITINGHSVNALLDSIDKSFIDNNIVKSLKLKVYPESGSVGLATSAMSRKMIGY